MELLLGVLIGVLVSFFALYLTRKLRMAEEKLSRDAERDAHSKKLLMEQVQALNRTYKHEPRHRSQYVEGSYYPVSDGLYPFSFTGLGTDIKNIKLLTLY